MRDPNAAGRIPTGRVGAQSPLLLAALIGGAALTTFGQAVQPAPASAWKWSAAAAVKETYDSNVYLQSQTPQANQASFVTALLPQLAGSWNPSPAFTASLNYSPEATWFHAAPSEDFVLHRVALNLSGKQAKTAYESATTLVLIDGSSVGPTWTGPGGAPATGGIPVRDRRAAAVYRSSLRVTQNFGPWFARPVCSLYVHDFQTEQRSTAGYQNYADRNEFLGGLDAGRKITAAASVWIGYRYGAQDQSRVLQFPEEYDSTFHRALFGVEGELAKWLKVSLALGPEFRRYGDKVPATFSDRDELNLFVDASATLTPTKADTVTLSVKQFEQPGFGGRSTYEDLTCDFTWRHKFNKRWTVGAGGRAYNTDFFLPVKRNDWILSANALINCAFTPALSVEASYVFEDGLTRTPNSSGREYERQLVALGLKYVFH